jgi:hypothetical protein
MNFPEYNNIIIEHYDLMIENQIKPTIVDGNSAVSNSHNNCREVMIETRGTGNGGIR